MTRPRCGAAATLCVLSWVARSAHAAPDVPVAPLGAAALAEDVTAGCLGSFEEAQRLRQQGSLIASQAELIACGQAVCPAVVQSQCVVWLRELSASLPSIVVVAKDSAGHDVVDVRVSVDANVVARALDGRAISLDPGLHRLRFERAGSPPVEESILSALGQQNRVVRVRFAAKRARFAPPVVAAATSPEVTPPSPGLPPLATAGFAVSVAGAITGTVLGLAALAKASSLDDACRANVCEPSSRGDIEEGKALAHASTASFVVSALGLGTGLVTLVLARREPDKQVAYARLTPVPFGTVVSFGGRF